MTERASKTPAEVLAKLVQGLVYISETDATFEVRDLGAAKDTSPAVLKDIFSLEAASPHHEVDVDDFFARLTSDQPWHDEARRKQVDGFRAFKKWIEENLSDIKVIRIGSIRIDIFIVGQTTDRHALAVHTRSVET